MVKQFKFYSGGTYEQRFQAVDHSWNDNLFYEIINYYNFPIKKDFLNINENKSQNTKQNLIKPDLNSNTLKKNIVKFFNKFKILRKKNDALITKTGLPFYYEKFLKF